MFTWTTVHRLQYRLSRLSYGMATWRGLDARKLAAEAASSGLTAAVITCRFPPGFQGPHAAKEWRRVAVKLGGADLRFEDFGRTKPTVIEIPAGGHQLRIEHDGPPPSFETSLDIAPRQILLIEVLPATEWAWFQLRPARVRIRSGDDQVICEAVL